MRSIAIIIPLLLLAGCESRYRYPCQDPLNWGKLECNNEICEADGTCTKQTIGPNIITNIQPNSAGQETIDTTNNEISNDVSEVTSCTPVQSDNKIVAHKPSKLEVMDPDSDEFEPPARTPQSMEEEPLSMNRIVNTAEHDAATK